MSGFRAGTLVVGFFAVACAPALSGFQPAHVPAVGHVQAELGADVSVSLGSVNSIVRASETLDHAAAQRMLTDDEKRAILAGGANLGLDPPAVIPHFGVAYSPLEHWELGLRFAASGWRVGVRRQLLEQLDSGVDFTVGVGFGRAIFDPPIHSVLETLTVNDFSRWALDFPVTLGQHGSWYRWWAGPRLLYSHTAQTMTLSLPLDNRTVTGSMSGHALYVGGYAGLVFGYRTIFLGPEFTVAKLFGSANVQALGGAMDLDIDSVVVYPALALMGEF
ncbi:MAG TPA: hypothetical protein VNW92_13280 [Polyangiaceae bacterium]|jgi:hypothetical protein|nr:hypothetical protein [Polyangiaceae bacterium]